MYTYSIRLPTSELPLYILLTNFCLYGIVLTSYGRHRVVISVTPTLFLVN